MKNSEKIRWEYLRAAYAGWGVGHQNVPALQRPFDALKERWEMVHQTELDFDDPNVPTSLLIAKLPLDVVAEKLAARLNQNTVKPLLNLFPLRHHIAVLTEQNRETLRGTLSDQIDPIIRAFLFNDAALAEEVFSERQGLAARIASAALFCTVRSTDTLVRLIPQVVDVHEFLPAMLRNIGEGAFEVFERIRRSRIHVFHPVRTHTDLLHAIRALGGERAFHAVCIGPGLYDGFAVAEWMAQEPQFVNWLHAQPSLRAQVLALRFEDLKPRPEAWTRLYNETDLPPRRSIRAEPTDVVNAAFYLAESEGVLEFDVANVITTHRLQPEQFHDCRWDLKRMRKGCYPPTALSGSVHYETLQRRFDDNRLRFPFPCGEPADAPDALKQMPQTPRLVSLCAPFLDHPNFVVREAADRHLNDAYLDSDRTWEAANSDREEQLWFAGRFDVGRTLLANRLPVWCRTELLKPLRELNGNAIPDRELQLFTWAAVALKRSLLEWSEDVQMVVSMIDAMLEEQVVIDPIDAFAPRLDFDSLTEFAFSVFELCDAFEKQEWLGFPTLFLFGGDKGIEFLFNEAIQSKSPTAFDLLIKSKNRAHLTRIIENLDSLEHISSVQFRIDRAANAHGLTSFSLWLLHAPTFGLTSPKLDVLFSNRHLTVDFSEPLHPEILNEKKQRIQSLPRPDGDLEQFKAVKAKMRSIQLYFTSLASRFDEIAGSRDRIPYSLFKTHVVDHPLLNAFATRIVWGVYDDLRRVATVRVQDRQLLNIDEEPVYPAEHYFIGVISPRELQKSEVSRWIETLADYEIIQPFNQFSETI